MSELEVISILDDGIYAMLLISEPTHKKLFNEVPLDSIIAAAQRTYFKGQGVVRNQKYYDAAGEYLRTH